jgi:zinc protease
MAALTIPLDSSVRTGTLRNGLRYYVRRNSEPARRAELRLVVNAGSILEDDDQRGLAHFVEHMAFNGTTHFRKHELVDYLRSVGMRFGGDLNASTSYDETVYRLTVPTDSARTLETALEILEDWAHGITMDSAEVVAERGVVLEEWRGRQGASSRIVTRHDSVLYRGSRYADRLPIGDPARISSTSRPDLLRFYHDWYRPELMAVIVVGDIDPAATVASIESRFGSIAGSENRRPRRYFRLANNPAPLVSIVTDSEATGSSLQLLYKLPPASDVGTLAGYRRALVERLYVSMLAQRLEEVARRSDAPFLGAEAAMGALTRTTRVHSYTVSVSDGEMLHGLEALLTEIERVAQHGFTQAELERANVSLLRGAESRVASRGAITSASYASAYTSNYLTGYPVPSVEGTLRMDSTLLPGISLREVNSLATVWRDSSNSVVLATLPAKGELRPPTRAELLALFDSVRSRKLEPYSEVVSDAPLVAQPPKAGPVVWTHEHPSVNVTEWRLANGVRVLLKPTDFNADQLLIRAFSPGGTSLAPDSLVLDAALATQLLAVGGLGDFDRVALQKRLAGSIVSVGASLNLYREGLEAGGSPRNMDTLFQLLYMQFTEPRIDTAAVSAFEASLRANLVNRAASPSARFRDTITAVMSRHHPRARTFTVAMVDSVDARRALEFYRDRFANASDFTFVIVGAFTLDSIRPLVERYLGGLPSVRRNESARDLGIRPPKGVVRRTVLAGSEPKSETVIFFTGEAPVTRESRYVLDAVNQVLGRRLTERLREELGGSYSPSVSATLGRFPSENYEITIGFGSAPDRADELTAAVLDAIRGLRESGPTARELHDVEEQQKRAREIGVRRNEYWLNTISMYAEAGWDLRGIGDRDPSGEGVELTVTGVRDAARRYLNIDNYAIFTLMPERHVRTDARIDTHLK